MAAKRNRKNRSVDKHARQKNELVQDLAATDTKEKYFEYFAIAVLLGFGIYHSILFFGHKAVPNSDFVAFVRTGHELLSFKPPSSLKRAPVLGILQVSVGNFIDGQHPDLTAGWLLNAILHPLNAILLWLVGKKMIGKIGALFLAILMILNPQVIYMLGDPIVETTLLFFVLLTCWFIFRRSKWCYLFAAIATMTRYEGAALILAAFIVDMIESKTNRERVKAFTLSAFASLPLIIWLALTFINFQGKDGTHYLKELGAASGGKFVLTEYMTQLWKTGLQPLMPSVTAAKAIFTKPGSAEIEMIKIIYICGKVLAVITFAFGAIYGLCKKNWNILVLLIFLVPYFIVHALHSFIFPRFITTVSWMVLLICFFGVQSIWGLINYKGRINRGVIIVGQMLLLIAACVWLYQLWGYIAKLAPVSEKSASLPYVGMGIVWVLFLARVVIYKLQYAWRDIVIVMVMCLLIVSNHIALAPTVRNGNADIEFKMLADWYVRNAEKGEKLVCSLAHVLRTIAPKQRRNFVNLGSIKADGPEDFVRKCYKKNITYIAWDSRLGFANPNDRYYKGWGFANIKMLSRLQNVGPYEAVTRMGTKRRHINLFRLHRPSEIIEQNQGPVR